MTCPRVFLTRHGNRIDFINKRWSETSPTPYDPHLSPDGVEQARQTGERLRGEGITAIYSSPFWRTVETAHAIAEVLDLPVLLETGAGEWLKDGWYPAQPELRPQADLAKAFPRVDVSSQSLVPSIFPESEEQAKARQAQTVQALIPLHDEPILVVGHGHSVMGMAQGLIPGAEIVHALCGIIQADRNGDTWTMILNGDTSHLDNGEQAANRLI